MTTHEIAAHNISHGMKQLPVAEIDIRLNELGYRRALDKKCDCNAQIMTGELAGKSYPCRTYGITHIATRLSFANVDAPHGPEFNALQEFRFSTFALSQGRIISL